ncbi:sulfite exporter TauE/SafE family protein [Deinococcus misasensis]|uniref:sulfite exporter TauE/SafE family protein n=1 Tax=Deinococcus misasensis TaxID=392413 RepID=UPI000558C5CF|nr:sulfite exporter TauE/SafE family protein [Deinococcus misasensis]
MIIAGILIGLLAGVLGAILGLGGGVVVVPALEFIAPRLGHDLRIQEAIAISQIGVLAVGIASTAGYLKRNLIQMRTGYLLSPYTVLGGAVGSVLGLVLPAAYVALVFALLLLYSAYTLIKGMKRVETGRDKPSPYVVPAMGFAGIMAGLLGIGGGTVQVPVMNLMLGLPIREAIATSTFIMGITATGNALVYQAAGLLDARVACAIALGILVGARLGANLQQRIPAQQLKLFFSLLLIYTAGNLIWKYWL